MDSSDIDAVTLLYLRRFQLCRRDQSDEEVMKGASFARQHSAIRSRLGSLETGAAVACQNGVVVGFILFRVSNTAHPALQLEWIARDARLEKAGVASTLIIWLIDFVKVAFCERPIRSVRLMVNLMNEAAIRLYCRLGFQRTERNLCDLEDDMLGCMELAI